LILLLLSQRVPPLLGSLRLDLLGLLLRRGPLGIALVDDSRQLLLQCTLTRPQVRHQGVGLIHPRDHASIALLEPAHLGVLPDQLGALAARDLLQLMRTEGYKWKTSKRSWK
jgi:hypothetical protein